ncbi:MULTISPECIES: PilW family protein [Acinetobacter]|uniref:PilW family protein n=1 Tax=Acinetobacter TaxID=469 RepID=UPI001487EEF9|nr:MULTISPECIES: PilW family protein [Acinetobacter]MDV8154857.1 PilW family protein [Acinetobacter bereziniae]
MSHDGGILVKYKNNLHARKGFTLLELIVAIAIGLIIAAAAMQLFIGGFLTSRMQEANAELQNSGIFGLDYMTRDIRLANFGNTRPDLNDQTPRGGIILTARDAVDTNTNITFPSSAPFISKGLLSHSKGNQEDVSGVKNEWQGLSNVNQTSDQLTIQFVAPNEMVNCEGNNVQEGDYVIQRYFLRQDPADASSGNNFALACDANTPTASGVTPVANPSTISGFGDAGQVIMPRVDHFVVQLGVRDSNNRLAYYSINQYRAEASKARAKTPAVVPPRIVAVKIAVLVRSMDDTKNQNIDLSKTISVLNQDITLKDTSTLYARRVYSTTVALRNGLGVPK